MKINKKADNLVQRIKDSQAFKIVTKTAIEVATKKWKLFRLISQVVAKIKEEGHRFDSGLLNKGKAKLMVFVELVKAYTKGTYRNLPKNSLLKIVAGLLYFLLVPDLIPDLLPIFGFVDDLSLLIWIANSVKKDLEDFEEWQKNQPSQPETSEVTG